MPESFSLRTGFMSSFDLSREEEGDIHDHIRNKIPHFPTFNDLSYPQWKLLKTKKDVSVWEERKNKKQIYTIRSSTTIQASVDEIMEVLECSKSNSYRTFMKVAYENRFGDASVLYSNTINEYEAISIKWMAFRSGSPLVFDVDFCLAEYSKINSPEEYTPPNNQDDIDVFKKVEKKPTPIAFKLMESIQTKHCPSLMESHKLERGHVPQCGYFLYPTERAEYTRIEFIMSISQNGTQIRRKANKSTLQSLALSLPRLQDAVDALRISRTLVARVGDWVRDIERTECNICCRRFSHIRRKHHCRLCGEIICHTCSVHKNAELPSIGLTTLRICKTCEVASVSSNNNPDDGIKSIKLTTSIVRKTKQKGNQNETNERKPLEHLILEKNNSEVGPSGLGSSGKRYVPGKSPIAKSRQPSTFSFTFDESINSSLPNLPNNRFIIPYQLSVVNTPADDVYKMLCELSSQALKCKYAAVSLSESSIHYFKSTDSPKLILAPSNMRCCEPVIRQMEPVLCLDMKNDERYLRLPIVIGPQKARFYAGAPLRTSNGHFIGAVCVFDSNPRQSINMDQVKLMESLTRLAVVSIEDRTNRLNEENTKSEEFIEVRQETKV